MDGQSDPAQPVLPLGDATSANATSTAEPIDRMTSAADALLAGAHRIQESDRPPTDIDNCRVASSDITITDKSLNADGLAVVHLHRGDIGGHGNGSCRSEGNEMLISGKLPSWSMVAAEAREQLQLGVPVTISYALYSLMQLSSYAFVGRLGTLPLAGTSIATSLANVSGMSILDGLSSGIETVGGQAVGAEAYETLGIVTLRVQLILLTVCFPVGACWLLSRPLLVAAGQEPAIALLASQYLAVQLPGILAYSLFNPLTKLLEVLGLTSPLIAITAISFSFLIASNCVLIYGLNMGFLGAALSFSLTLFLQLIVTLAYIYFFDYSHGLMRRCFPFLLTPSHPPSELSASLLPSSSPSHSTPTSSPPSHPSIPLSPPSHLTLTSSPPSIPLISPPSLSPSPYPHPSRTSSLVKELFTGWPPYLAVAVPSTVMICMEWWCFEILLFVAGWLPNPEVEVVAITIGFQFLSLLYMLPCSFAIAASVRVSNELGAGKPLAARHAAYVAVALALVASACLALFVLSVRNHLVWVFAGAQASPQLTALVHKLLPYLVVCLPGMCVPTVLQGVIRGVGQQTYGSIVNAISFYALGLPVSLFLSFGSPAFGAVGLWMGFIIAQLLQAAVFLAHVASLDWTKQAAIAGRRVEANR